MEKCPSAFLFALCVLLAAFGPTAAFAKNKAEIVDTRVDLDGEHLEVSFGISNCFTPKMEEAIRSGVRTTFKIRVVLEKPGPPLLRGQVLDIALEHTIKYDRLKNEYRVQLPEHPDRVCSTRDLEEAKVWMSSVKDLPVIPMWRLQKGQSYRLRLKAELSKFQLPLFLRYIFFFVSLWDFESDWQKVNISL